MADKDLKTRLAENAGVAADAIKEHGVVAAKATVRAGKAILETRDGKRAAVGAAAGGAIGYALPLISIAAGAALGAGLLVLWRSLKDND